MYFATLCKWRRYIQRRPVAEVRNNNKDKSKTDNKNRNKNNNKLLRKERRQECGIAREVFIELLG